MRARFHPGATADLTSAGDWYERQLAGLGAVLAEEVDHALAAIIERPMTWPHWPGVGEPVGVRRFLLARFPFAVPADVAPSPRPPVTPPRPGAMARLQLSSPPA